MRSFSACGLTAAAVLSLAACSGGDSASNRALTTVEIQELTGLSASVETPEAAGIFEQSDIVGAFGATRQ